MNKTVVLTGAAGFIGSHMLTHLLVNTDWHIHCLCSFTHKGIPERITQDKHYQTHKDRVSVHWHDLNAPLSPLLQEKLKDTDYILNFASDSHVDRSITDPVPFIQNNINVVLNMLEFARKLSHLQVFIQISTDEVYGPAPKGMDHKEWSTILPSNPYSASKAAQEAIAISYWRTYGIPIIITNTMNNIGERQDSEKFVPMLIKKINAGEKVVIHGSKEHGIGSRFYLHARNHADAILHILKKLHPTLYDRMQVNTLQIPDRYNVVGDIELNNLELAQMIAQILNKELQYSLVEFHHTRPGHDRRYALDGTKLKDAGWKAPIKFKDSLRKTIAWTLANPEWLKI